MAKCGYCGSLILMGGVRAGAQRFCNRKCYQNLVILNATQNIPAEVVSQKVEEVWRGNCPKCRGLGPVEIHKVYQVWSILVLTRWSTQLQVSCRDCATKSQLGGAAFSLCLGWWGIPWGLILTPVQITRNVMGMRAKGDGSQPSEALRKMVLIHLGKQMMAQQQAAQQATAGQPPTLSGPA